MFELSNLLKKPITGKEIDAILNHLSQAALLWDEKLNEIFACNLKAVEQTGYSRKDFEELSLQDLFPLFPKNFIYSSPFDVSTNLQDRSGKQTAVNVNISRIGTDTNWLMLTFESEIEVQQKEIEQSLQNQRWEALLALALAPKHETLEEALKHALQAGQLLTGSSFLALYTPDEDNANLLKINASRGSAEALPESVKRSEISHLKLPYVWQPGIRGTSTFHQKALAAKLTYLASIPIQQTTSQEGILIIGDQIGNPPEEITHLLQILAGCIESCLTHFQTLAKITKDTQSVENAIAVSEMLKNQISDGLIFVDEFFIIQQINDAALFSLGYAQDEAVGKSIDSILVIDHPISKILAQQTNGHSLPLEIGEVKTHRRDGQAALTHIRIIPLPEGDPKSRFAILLSDLSAREEYKNRAKQLEGQAVLGEVMAIFAHEVRNPINNIGMGLEVLSSSFDEDSEIQTEIKRLQNDVNRLEDLMKSVLSVSRSRKYKMVPVNLQVQLETLVQRWKPRMERYKIEPVVICNQDIPLVRGDHRSLDQVFTNIIQNAINAMKGSGGKLMVRLTHAPNDGKTEYVNIDISDNGPGIPKEIMQKIFEPFFTTSSDGNGLGLAITKQIINAHNGKISANSVPDGTVFRIQLPVQKTNLK